jgi:hypothetical protein
VLGRRGGGLGQLGRLRAREKKEKASGLLACGLKEEKGREREGKGFCFFKFSFQIHFFQTFKLQSNKIHAFES